MINNSYTSFEANKKSEIVTSVTTYAAVLFDIPLFPRLEKPRPPANIQTVHQQQQMAGTPSQAIEELLNSYHELNHDFVDELTDLPSPLEFMRRTLFRTQFCGFLLSLNARMRK